jgi:hypothetical protein
MQGGFGGFGGFNPMQGGFGGFNSAPMNPPRPSVFRPNVTPIPTQSDAPTTPAPSSDMNAIMAPMQDEINQMRWKQTPVMRSLQPMQPSGGRMVGFDPMIQQQRAQEQEQLRQQGITPINPNDPTLMAVAQRNRQLDLENQANYGQQQQQQMMQQTYQEDPRMQAMRNLQMMRGGFY